MFFHAQVHSVREEDFAFSFRLCAGFISFNMRMLDVSIKGICIFSGLYEKRQMDPDNLDISLSANLLTPGVDFPLTIGIQ